MIKEDELRDAIAECQGQRNPNANTCIKLASYLTILDHMENKPVMQYSYSTNTENTIQWNSRSEFANAVYGRDISEIMAIMDELMTTLQVINPRLYDGVMRQL